MKLLLAVSLLAGLLASFSGLLPAIAAERPTNPAQLLLWFLSLSPHEETERQKINVNSASAEELSAVPGLDRRQALQIIAHRPYASLHDLGRAGLSARSIDRLAGLLTVDARATAHAARPSAR
jgi:DNA uptake protein ComE-like DNA-binding protein